MQRRAQEIRNCHSRDFARILKCEKESFACAVIWLEREDIFAVHRDLALGDLVIGMAGHYFGERAFARAVRAHDRMHFAARNGQTQAADDLLVADRDMEIFNTKLIHKGGGQKYKAIRGDCERHFIV